MLLKRIIEEWNLYEGLEITHEVESTVDNLNLWWNFEHRVHFEKKGYKIEAVIKDLLDKKNIDDLFKRLNNAGYFPSAQSFNNYWDWKKFDYNSIILKFKDIFNFFFIVIVFDPKYDPEIDDKEIPSFGYHITPTKYEEKILKIGLAPKSKEKLTKHPERIYFTKNVDDAEMLLGSDRFKGENKDFTIFQINFKELKKHRAIRYFLDPRFVNNKGIYIYENIPPQYLTVLTYSTR